MSASLGVCALLLALAARRARAAHVRVEVDDQTGGVVGATLAVFDNGMGGPGATVHNTFSTAGGELCAATGAWQGELAADAAALGGGAGACAVGGVRLRARRPRTLAAAFASGERPKGIFVDADLVRVAYATRGSSVHGVFAEWPNTSPAGGMAMDAMVEDAQRQVHDFAKFADGMGPIEFDIELRWDLGSDAEEDGPFLLTVSDGEGVLDDNPVRFGAGYDTDTIIRPDRIKIVSRWHSNWCFTHVEFACNDILDAPIAPPLTLAVDDLLVNDTCSAGATLLLLADDAERVAPTDAHLSRWRDRCDGDRVLLPSAAAASPSIVSVRGGAAVQFVGTNGQCLDSTVAFLPADATSWTIVAVLEVGEGTVVGQSTSRGEQLALSFAGGPEHHYGFSGGDDVSWLGGNHEVGWIAAVMRGVTNGENTEITVISTNQSELQRGDPGKWAPWRQNGLRVTLGGDYSCDQLLNGTVKALGVFPGALTDDGMRTLLCAWSIDFGLPLPGDCTAVSNRSTEATTMETASAARSSMTTLETGPPSPSQSQSTQPAPIVDERVPPSPSTPSEDSTPIILGVVGAIVGLLCVVAVGVPVMRRRLDGSSSGTDNAIYGKTSMAMVS